MPIRPLVSRLQPNTDVFKKNYEANHQRLETLRQVLGEARQGGGEKYVNRFLADLPETSTAGVPRPDGKNQHNSSETSSFPMQGC